MFLITDIFLLTAVLRALTECNILSEYMPKSWEVQWGRGAVKTSL